MRRASAEQLSRSAVLALLVMAGCTLPGGDGAAPRSEPPRTDCRARVGADRDAVLPGYRLPASHGGTVCVPFLPSANRPPSGRERGGFYVDEFTDAKLKARWH